MFREEGLVGKALAWAAEHLGSSPSSATDSLRHLGKIPSGVSLLQSGGVPAARVDILN